jgi:hypothetical protein
VDSCCANARDDDDDGDDEQVIDSSSSSGSAERCVHVVFFTLEACCGANTRRNTHTKRQRGKKHSDPNVFFPAIFLMKYHQDTTCQRSLTVFQIQRGIEQHLLHFIAGFPR